MNCFYSIYPWYLLLFLPPQGKSIHFIIFFIATMQFFVTLSKSSCRPDNVIF